MVGGEAAVGPLGAVDLGRDGADAPPRVEDVVDAVVVRPADAPRVEGAGVALAGMDLAPRVAHRERRGGEGGEAGERRADEVLDRPRALVGVEVAREEDRLAGLACISIVCS